MVRSGSAVFCSVGCKHRLVDLGFESWGARLGMEIFGFESLGFVQTRLFRLRVWGLGF